MSGIFSLIRRYSLPAALLLCAVAPVLDAQQPAVKPAAKPAIESSSRTVPQTTAAQPQLTREDLEAFMDGIAPMQLKQGDIGGMVVAVVKDGKVLFAKGYGYSDVARKKPVSVDSTLFRIGSISKTFTWTAVMQLVEEGKLDLNKDVNSYIDFKIPAPFGKPVTMANLMTHTPGFEEVLKELFVTDTTNITPLKSWLPNHLPTQIYEPGTTPAYSNYGATLAGYIVERVSGEPFDDYIDAHILRPLGMSNTTFRQPLPASLAPMMSKGYQKASDSAKAYEYVAAWPAGSVAATAENMTHFMIAHLQDGEYNGARILKPETAQLMHARLFGAFDALPGMAHGFYEEGRNGHRIVGHGGDTQWFHSDMHLMLDDHIGFFVSYNSAGNGKGTGRAEIWHQFLDRYFPYTPAPVAPVATALADARSVAGTYRSSRRSQTTFVSGVELASQQAVTVNPDTTISAKGMDDLAGNPIHFREIGPKVFRETGGQEMIAFKTDPAGVMVMGNPFPFEVAQRASLAKNGKMNEMAAGFALFMFLLTLLSWPLNAMFRKHYAAQPSLDRNYRVLRWVMRALCAANLLFAGLVIKFFANVSSDIGAFSSRSDAHLRVVQLIGLIGAVGALVAIYYGVRSWKSSTLWVWAKVWNTLLAVAFVAFAFFILNWHLLTTSLRY
jgi:CubicO group peptidase (beta-lactamase class C family)